MVVYLQIFERSELAQETSAAVHIAPNAYGLLKRFGLQPESIGANPVKGVSSPSGKAAHLTTSRQVRLVADYHE